MTKPESHGNRKNESVCRTLGQDQEALYGWTLTYNFFQEGETLGHDRTPGEVANVSLLRRMVCTVDKQQEQGKSRPPPVLALRKL